MYNLFCVNVYSKDSYDILFLGFVEQSQTHNQTRHSYKNKSVYRRDSEESLTTCVSLCVIFKNRILS